MCTIPDAVAMLEEDRCSNLVSYQQLRFQTLSAEVICTIPDAVAMLEEDRC
jgi:hypothetical protein